MAAEPSKTFSQPLRTFRNFQNLCRTIRSFRNFPNRSRALRILSSTCRDLSKALQPPHPRAGVPTCPTPPYRTCSWRIIPPQPSTSPGSNRSTITPAPSKVPPDFFRTRPRPSKNPPLEPFAPRLKPSLNNPIEIEPKTTTAGEISHSHGFARRHCWAIPPHRCSASRGNGGHWDSEKDLVEVFSICCPANEVRSSYWDFAKDLLEAFSNNCSASRGNGGHWDSEKDLLEVFSSNCPASEVRPDIPSHQTLQQAAQSNSCFPNASGLWDLGLQLDVNMMWHCQPLAWVSFHSSIRSIRYFHIHPCSTPSQLPGEMPQEAWWVRCFWGPGTKGIRGCERFLAFRFFAAM